MNYPKAFISCSYNQEFSKIVDYYKSVIESCGFYPMLINHIEGIEVEKKIKSYIEECEILVCIVLCSPSEFISNEIGIAYSLEKPIILIKDYKITISGIAPKITDYKDFDIDYYWMIVPDLVKVLKSKYKYFMSSFSVKYYLIRKHVKSKISIQENSIENVTEIEILNLSDELNEVYHGLMLYNNNEIEKAQEIEFFADTISKGTTIEVKKVKSENSFKYKLEFVPPLSIGESIKYMYKNIMTNYLPWKKDDLKSMMENNNDLQIPYCEKNYTVSTPTELLDLRIELPFNYIITKVKLEVTYYKANIVLEEEEARIINNKYFKQEKFAGKSILKLIIPFPKLFARYSIKWQPYE